MKFCRKSSRTRFYSVEFSNILSSFRALYCHKQNSTALNDSKQQIHSISSNFVILILQLSVSFKLLSSLFEIQGYWSLNTKAIQIGENANFAFA